MMFNNPTSRKFRDNTKRKKKIEYARKSFFLVNFAPSIKK